MIRRLVDGRAAEVGLVGREGMVGLPVLLGNDVSYVEALVQASGIMLRISADAFRRSAGKIRHCSSTSCDMPWSFKT